MKILITGARGLVGRAVSEHCSKSGDEVLSYDHRSMDITDHDLVRQIIAGNTPDVVINCAAWTDVDGCEADAARAFAVNAHGPENLALASRDVNAAFVTISTDYVFDGTKEGFYTQEDEPNPLSVYGRAKLEGEQRSQEANKESIVVRSGFIFGRGGTNFLSTVVDRARRNEPLKAITDSYGTPTYARDLAQRLRELAEMKHAGIFHVVNSGEGTSYAGFVREAVRRANLGEPPIEEVLTASLNRPAPRPQNSRMRCLHSPALGLPPLPDWRDALSRFARETSGVGDQNAEGVG